MTLATANALKESLGEYLTDVLVILWLKPTSPNGVFQPEKRTHAIHEAGTECMTWLREDSDN